MHHIRSAIKHDNQDIFNFLSLKFNRIGRKHIVNIIINKGNLNLLKGYLNKFVYNIAHIDYLILFATYYGKNDIIDYLANICKTKHQHSMDFNDKDFNLCGYLVHNDFDFKNSKLVHQMSKNINKIVLNFTNVIFFAVRENHPELLNFIFTVGNYRNSSIYDQLFIEAVDLGYLDVVKILVEQRVDLESYLECALNTAKQNNHDELVKYLRNLTYSV